MRRTSVGARELKTRPGTYLRQVRQGRTLVITERGEPVAELRPLPRAENAEEEALARMESRGEITRGIPGPLTSFRPLKLRGPGGPLGGGAGSTRKRTGFRPE